MLGTGESPSATGARPMPSASAAITRARAGIMRRPNSGASTNSGPTRPITSRKPAIWRSPISATQLAHGEATDGIDVQRSLV